MFNYIAVVMQTSKIVLLTLYLIFLLSLKMAYLMQLKELLPNEVILVLTI